MGIKLSIFSSQSERVLFVCSPLKESICRASEHLWIVLQVAAAVDFTKALPCFFPPTELTKAEKSCLNQLLLLF